MYLMPEEAIRNARASILSIEKETDTALMRYNCASDVPIPGEEPQVWVRWNSKLDDWEDVQVKRLSPGQLRSYEDQKWRDELY